MSAPETPWLTIDQAAERLQVSVKTVERMVTDGNLREYRPRLNSTARRYRPEDVDAAMLPVPQQDDSTT